MPIFEIKNQKFSPIKEVRISLEKDIQKITELNLALMLVAWQQEPLILN